MNVPVPRIGIPTLYTGVLMRSRTEARWAAMFDEMHWGWEYEPFDLEGYIPDFLCHLGATDILCEIKSTDEDFQRAQDKLDMTSYDGRAMILGQGIDGGVCGRIREADGPGWHWCQAQFFYCLSCGQPSVLAVEGSWTCRRCGDGHGNAHVGDLDLSALWAKATNRVQWRPE